MRVVGDPADNPDQRIAEDLELFAVRTIEIGIGLIGAVLTLVSFVVILWSLSGAAAFPLFGSTITIPGYLVWAALLYAVLGTIATHYIGRPLIGLNFNQQRFEADFRYHLVRVRENGEQIALLDGEPAEQRRLGERFSTLVGNFRRIMNAQKRLTGFSASYTQASIIFPFVVVSPAYFAGTISLGILTQTASAFGQVQNSLSFFVRIYATLAEWRAVVERLTGFEQAVAEGERLKRASQLTHEERDGIGLGIESLDVRLPAGAPLVRAEKVSIAPAESVLVTGADRLGQVDPVPRDRRHLAVRRGQDRDRQGQEAHGAAAAALCAVRHARRGADLSRCARRLFARGAVRSARCGGTCEVQGAARRGRVLAAHAFARRAAAALAGARAARQARPAPARRGDLRARRGLRRRRSIALLAKRLPQATVISIGHRSTLFGLHQRRFDFKRLPDGGHRMEPAPLAAA